MRLIYSGIKFAILCHELKECRNIFMNQQRTTLTILFIFVIAIIIILLFISVTVRVFGNLFTRTFMPLTSSGINIQKY